MPTTPAGRAADFIAPVDHGELPRWELADLPAPPPFGMRNLFTIIGPGAIMAATSIGGGEWLVGPAAAVKYSSSIFLIATIAIVLQVLFNIEAIRYTVYTGEPIYGGIMRLKPGPEFWAAFYSFLGFFQLGWPALAGSAAATLFGAWMGRMPGAPDQATTAWITIGLILFVVLILSFGGTIERMLEYFAWTMLGVVFLFLIVINIAFVPAAHWWRTFTGFFSFTGLPQPIDWGLIGALAATAGSGGLGNLTVTNWVRDKGFGMAATVGAIPSAVGGHAIKLTHVGKIFPATPENIVRWREWMKYVHADQIWVWGLFCFLGMFLNVNLATAIIPHGTDLQGLAAGAYQAEYLEQDLAGLLVPHAVQRLLDPVQDAAGQHRHSRAHDHGRDLDVELARPRVGQGHSRDLLRHPARVLGVGHPRDPIGVAVSALQDPGEHGRRGAAHRGRADFHRQSPVSSASRAAAAVARDRPARVLRVLRVFHLLRRPRFVEVADVVSGFSRTSRVRLKADYRDAIRAVARHGDAIRAVSGRQDTCSVRLQPDVTGPPEAGRYIYRSVRSTRFDSRSASVTRVALPRHDSRRSRSVSSPDSSESSAMTKYSSAGSPPI